ncbi:secretin N-terminal domain-containing protein [Candidatus Omnitrophota bacterium]
MKKETTIRIALIVCLSINVCFWGVAAESDLDEFDSTISESLDYYESTPEQIAAREERVRRQLQEAEDFLAELKESQPEPDGENKKEIILDTLELSGMDILAVLKLISKKSGLNIVAGKNVAGKVTIYLKEVEVWDALNIILSANNLAYEEKEGIIQVMTDRDYELLYGKKFGDKSKAKVINLRYAGAADLLPILNQMKSIIGKVMADEQSNTIVMIDTPDNLIDMERFIERVDVPVITKVFDLNYTKAEELEKQVSELLTKNVGTIKIDVRTNKIIIKDTPEKMKEVETIIGAFDERHKEVLIEAKIVKVILSDQYKMGVDWEYIFSKYHDLSFAGNFDILSSSEKFGKVSIGTLETDDYTAFIEALNTIGETNTLSSPRITAINNEEAKILVGSTEPYVTSTTTTSASGPSTTAESVNFIEVGVKLYVTPTISKDNFITMKIKPEVSAVDRFLTTSNNNSIPIVETSEAETSVMVKDGATIVIGGLIKDELIKTVNKTPVLGDIPIVGHMFRSVDNLKRKTELVIFLTPHIITGESDPFSPAGALSLAQ